MRSDCGPKSREFGETLKSKHLGLSIASTWIKVLHFKVKGLFGMANLKLDV